MAGTIALAFAAGVILKLIGATSSNLWAGVAGLLTVTTTPATTPSTGTTLP